MTAKSLISIFPLTWKRHLPTFSRHKYNSPQMIRQKLPCTQISYKAETRGVVSCCCGPGATTKWRNTKDWKDTVQYPHYNNRTLVFAKQRNTHQRALATIMDKSLGTLSHFGGVFRFTKAQLLFSPHKQCWTRVSTIFPEFQLCIGWGEGELQENFKKDALFCEGTHK